MSHVLNSYGRSLKDPQNSFIFLPNDAIFTLRRIYINNYYNFLSKRLPKSEISQGKVTFSPRTPLITLCLVKISDLSSLSNLTKFSSSPTQRTKAEKKTYD